MFIHEKYQGNLGYLYNFGGQQMEKLDKERKPFKMEAKGTIV